MYFFVSYISKLNILEVYSVSTVYHLLHLEVMEVTVMETTLARNASTELIPWGLWQRCSGYCHTW